MGYNSVLVPDEHLEQVAFVKWFNMQFPHILIFAIPNGGKRGKLTAIKLQAEGVVAGIPDLFIPEWNLWIEMKRQKKGVISKEQKGIIEYLNKFHTVIIGYGCKDAIEKIKASITQKRSETVHD